jgi:hypothetical protein
MGIFDCAVAYETARLRILPGREHPWQSVLQCRLGQKRALKEKVRRPHDEKTVDVFSGHGRKRRVEVLSGS